MPIRVTRVDKATPLSVVSKTDEGYLRVTAPIASSSVYSYLLPDGSIRREYIPKSTLFNTDSIDSLKLKPVTNTHPIDFVDTESFVDLSVGSVGESISGDGDYLVANFMVSDSDSISQIENNDLNQLSPAYTCDVQMTSGVTASGETYDAIQVDRKYNHLALVSKARGGDELAIRIDCKQEVGVQITKTDKGDEIMGKTTIHLDGVDHTIENQAIVNHISSLTAEVEAKSDAMGSKDAEIVTLTAKIDAKDAEIQELSKKTTDSAIDAKVNAKVALIAKASAILGDEEVKSDSSDVDIMKAVVLKVNPTAKFDGYDGDLERVYVQARFDSAIEQAEKELEADNRKEIKDPKEPKESKADSYDSHMDSMTNRWKESK